MADPTQYTFSFIELAKLMFQSAGIHEGRWVLGVEFNIAVGQMGTTPNEAYPGAILTANKLMITAATEGNAPPNLTFDAGTLNPKPKSKSK